MMAHYYKKQEENKKLQDQPSDQFLHVSGNLVVSLNRPQHRIVLIMRTPKEAAPVSRRMKMTPTWTQNGRIQRREAFYIRVFA